MAESPWQVRDVTVDYETGRPDYPASLARLLTQDVGLTRRSVAVDLAAGTGKLTRMLLPLVDRVIAVDPAERMLTALGRASPSASVVAGTAEAIPLRDECADSVLVGNAFHWFRDEALGEMTRVVRPGGSLVVIWNIPHFELRYDSHIRQLLDALAPYRTSGPSGSHFHSSPWLDRFKWSGRVGPLQRRGLHFEHAWSRRGLTAYVGSWSTVATLSDQARTEVLATVAHILSTADEPIVVPHVCEAHWTFSTLQA
jgi:ubiquinone/menaquinone biosynthesis C-methylase UbiE